MGQILYDVIEDAMEAVDLSVPSRGESGSDMDSDDGAKIPEDEEYWQGADTDYGTSDDDDDENDQDKFV